MLSLHRTVKTGEIRELFIADRADIWRSIWLMDRHVTTQAGHTGHLLVAHTASQWRLTLVYTTMHFKVCYVEKAFTTHHADMRPLTCVLTLMFTQLASIAKST